VITREEPGFIYHIATASDWAQARGAGEYTTSTLGRTLAEEGFIHCSAAGQVAGVANMFYQGLPDLLVLAIDTGRVRPEIRLEQVAGSAEPFPHIYGPLNVDAVVEARRFEPGPDGRFAFPAGVRPGGDLT
jgi:uncharacterized protein (DUF952 family)